MEAVQLYIRDVVSNPIQPRQVINENNQYTIKLSTDKQHVIIGMHHLEHKPTQHTVEWVMTLG
jgi:hypothetical protein